MQQRSLFWLYLLLLFTLSIPLWVLSQSPHAQSDSPFTLRDGVLWGLMLGFPLVLYLLIRHLRRLHRGLDSLQMLVDSAERGLVDYDHIRFPEGPLGSMGRKIADTYRQAELNRRVAEKEREKKRLYKQQMSNNITHELRTPVAAIQGYLETLVLHPEIDAQRQHFFLERAHLQSQRLGALIRDVALITKMEEAAELMPREEVDLCQILADVMADLEGICQQRELRLCSLLPPSLPLRGNYSLLYAILRNLIENSLKYAAPCECTLELLEGSPSHWQLSYRDTGRGVPEEHLSRLFDRFYRPDYGRTRSSTDEGSGLGLSIVRNAVVFHGGQICVSNHPEGGLMFEFSLRRLA